MSNKPIFVATHPRACSTAFERVFMTRQDTLRCVHEPFGDAFYYGPERLSDRFEKDAQARKESGFDQSTYKTILDRIDREAAEGKRLFIKDIAHYLAPPDGKPSSVAPSLTPPGSTSTIKKGVGTAPYPYGTVSEPSNPTVIPTAILAKFHFTFLIRHPRSSVPSYYRCTVPPLDAITGFPNYMPSEAGYDEVRRIFDYLRTVGQIGPEIAGQTSANGEPAMAADGVGKSAGNVSICVVDADDLLDDPAGIIQAYCQAVGLDYSPDMLRWDTPEDHAIAKAAFEKWRGFHEDAIDSTDLKPRAHVGLHFSLPIPAWSFFHHTGPPTRTNNREKLTSLRAKKKTYKEPKEEDAEWTAKFGAEGAKVMRETVEKNVKDYEYLKSFAIKV